MLAQRLPHAAAMLAVPVFAVLVFAGGTTVPAAAKERPASVGLYGVLERSLPFKSSAANPWDQVNADVRLVSPSRKVFRIGGFYSGPGLWKFRFAPPQVGRWTWTARVSDASGGRNYRGSFVVAKGSSPGFVRQSPFNRLRWTFQNRAPYYPIGLNECTKPWDPGDRPLSAWGLDGGFRTGNGDHRGRVVSMTSYLRAYGAAGFNLFRWGPDNCSYALFNRIDPAGNQYSVSGGAVTDRLFQALRSNGFRIEMVVFGSPPFANGATSTQLAAVNRYVKYVVDRYGAYVDFWELMNEASASEPWLTEVGGYLRQIDPYGHPLGTSWSAPQLSVMQFGSDHWYESEEPGRSDTATWSRLRGESARQFGKPTLVDEQGNIEQNWDPTSALRVRLRSWTAFFAEGTLVFWNASFAKDYRNPNAAANVYLGPQERKYVRVLQTFTRNFDPRAQVVEPQVIGPARAYALQGPRHYGLYVVAAGDRRAATSGVRVRVTPARAGSATWIDPASGRVIGRAKVAAGAQTLTVPPFTVDVALKIS